MAFESRPGDGVLFPADRGTNDRAPTMTGYVLAHRDIRAGERVRLAAWPKHPRGGGEEFLSLKLSDERGEAQRGGGSRGTPGDLADEVPFSAIP